jgi:SAM-dependent methyltransferase
VRQVSSTTAAEAWTLFWSEQRPDSRCLARSPELCECLDAHWRAFASTLSPSARVIDLGCGAGAVGRALRSAEPRLHVTGIDIAQIPTSREQMFELLSNVAMESLPFADGTFGAAVSQFGYEYADPDLASKEIARVLVAGASISFLIHHPEGPIVRAMRLHRRAIEGLCGLHVQAAFLGGNGNALAERIAMLKREFSNDAVVEQAERGLHTHVGKDEFGRLQVWKAVVEALAPELVMLDSLDLCCTDQRDIEDLVTPLADDFDLQRGKSLRTRLGEPIAWIVDGVRRP